MYIKSFFYVFFLILIGCTNLDLKQRLINTDQLVQSTNFSKKMVSTDHFLITTYQKVIDPDQDFIFYIEGDGFIYHNSKVTNNSTPNFPIALQLSILDSRSNVIYIARPCQFINLSIQPQCKSEYWTIKRFAPEVIDTIYQVINSITDKKFTLIGFSGGGGIAILIAAKHPERVKNIITIAANLDHIEFNNFHHSHHMTKSLNPIDYADKVKNIPQLHLSGKQDNIIPSFLSQKFIKHVNSNCAKGKVINSTSHNSGWQKIWPEILQLPITCD